MRVKRRVKKGDEEMMNERKKKMDEALLEGCSSRLTNHSRRFKTRLASTVFAIHRKREFPLMGKLGGGREIVKHAHLKEIVNRLALIFR